MTVHLTNRELDVIAVLWQTGSATVSEVRAAVGDELAYTTILSVLRGLELKQYVRHESEGKAHRFFPTIQPSDAEDKSLGRVLDKLYQGSRELLITRLVAEKELSRTELERIRAIIDERLGEAEE